MNMNVICVDLYVNMNGMVILVWCLFIQHHCPFYIMRKAELEDVDWRMLAQDRAQWRMVVHRAAETYSHPYP